MNKEEYWEKVIEEIKEAMDNGYWDAKGYGESGGADIIIDEINKVFKKYNIKELVI